MKPEIVLICAIDFLIILIGIFCVYPGLALESEAALEGENLVVEADSGTEYFLEGFGRKEVMEFSPSINDVRRALEEDKIDKVVYSDDFNCVEFSFGLVKALKERGIYSCIAWVIFENGSHALVAVNTSHYGVIYIEPQTDKIIWDLKEGDDYCDAAGWNCDWKIQKIKSCFSEINY